MTEVHRILIVRNDRLGDVILSLPVVNAFHNKYPHAKLFFWTSPAVADLLRCIPQIDSVIASNDKNNTSIKDALNTLQIDTAICLRPTYSNAKTLWKAGIRNRIGTSRRWYSVMFNSRKNITRKYSPKHESVLNLELAGISTEGELPDFPSVELPIEIITKVDSTISEFTKQTPVTPLIVIHPGSGGSARDWPPEYFRQLGFILKEQVNANLIVTGGSSELERCRLVSQDLALNLSGKTNLLELAALLSRAQLVVANSTGPLHLGVLMGAKVLGIYPPVQNCLPDRWGPYKHPEWALVPELPLCPKCRPGIISTCFCMEQLTPKKVAKHIIENYELCR